MNFFEPSHLIIVAVVALVLFGGKMPELMKNVGKGVGELKKGIEEGKRQLSQHIEDAGVSSDDHSPATPPLHVTEHGRDDH